MHAVDRDVAPKYRTTSWVDSRIECRLSPISGQGLFACEPIKQGEVVIVWGGQLFLEAALKACMAKERSVATIGEGLYLGSVQGSVDCLDEFMNHACDPNVWLHDEVTLIAMRAIARDEELTLDYALFETDDSWRMECRCGSSMCRRLITGRDWQLTYLQAKYQHHFSPYINDRIAASARRIQSMRRVIKMLG